MGGFTVVYLKDRSEANIAKHNELLAKYKVAKKYRFYSLADVRFQYDAFKANKGIFPAEQFPKDKIKTFDDFQRYWNPNAIGEVFVAFTGSLSFDCYFGRTSKNAMRNIGRYIADHWHDILAVSGSFDTFMERGMNKLERQLITEKISELEIKDTYNVQGLYESPYKKVYP